MLEFFVFSLFLILFFSLVIAVYTDLKKRIVPNKLSFFLIFSGLIGNLFISLFENNFFWFYSSVVSGLLAFVLAFALYKFGVWAGGDVKLFSGVGFMMPFNPSYFFSNNFTPFFPKLFFPVFFLHVFIASIFSVLPLTIAVLALKLFFNKKIKQKVLSEIKFKTKNSFLPLSFLSPFFLFLNNFFGFNPFFFVFYLFALIVFFRTAKKKTLVFSVPFFLFSITSNFFQALNAFLFSFFFLFVAGTSLALLKHSSELFSKRVAFTDLREGMISGESIIVKKDRIQRRKGINITKIISLYMKGKPVKAQKLLSEEFNALCSPLRASGLTKKEIVKLKEIAKEKKLEPVLIVRDSLPFVPFIFTGFLLTLLVGDFLTVFL